VTIWGCRGSCAAPGPDTTRYGGNTACVEVRLDDGTVIILDAGTGLRSLGLKLQAERARDVHLLLSHFHLDHLVGLGFFSLLKTDGVTIHLWGAPSDEHSLEERIARYMSPPLFPVRLSDAASRVQLHEIPTGPWRLGGALLHAEFVTHTGPTLGYRIEENGSSLAYIPDHEPALDVDLRSAAPEALSGFRLAAGADVLLHDAQYTTDEYAQRVGWGHSSLEHAVTFAQRAGVGRLILFHHDPTHSDDQLESMESECRGLWDAPGHRPALAREGMELDLATPAPPPPPTAGQASTDPASTGDGAHGALDRS
jgi:phosphoribosyl 1,2-cyclic phosphodiesterase